MRENWGLFLFDRGQHINALLMLSAFKFGVKEGIEKLAGQSVANDALAKAENVCVVVESGGSCAEGVRADGGADPAVLVCRHGHTDSRAADQDSKLACAVLDIFAHAARKNGIVAAVGGICSDVNDIPTLFLQVGDQLLLEIIGCVIAADRKDLFHIRYLTVWD